MEVGRCRGRRWRKSWKDNIKEWTGQSLSSLVRTVDVGGFASQKLKLVDNTRKPAKPLREDIQCVVDLGLINASKCALTGLALSPGGNQ